MTNATAQARGRRLRQLREDLRYTQREVAELAGVARVTVTAWENGDLEKASVMHFARLAQVLGTTVEDLVLGVKPKYEWDMGLVRQALDQLDMMRASGIPLEGQDGAEMFVRLYDLARRAGQRDDGKG